MAFLYDDPNTKDTFKAWPDQAKLYGDEFYVAAKSFRRVSAYATAGGGDKAYLYDSALDEFPDHLKARENWAQLSNDLLRYAYWVSEFEEVFATSSNESDTKDVVDPAALDFILNAEEW